MSIVADAGSSLVYNGTSGNDTLRVTGLAGPKGNVLLNNQLPVQTSRVTSLTLNGLAGDNNYGITAGNSLPYTTITVNGSGAADPDVVAITGDGGAVAVALGSSTPKVTDAP